MRNIKDMQKVFIDLKKILDDGDEPTESQIEAMTKTAKAIIAICNIWKRRQWHRKNYKRNKDKISKQAKARREKNIEASRKKEREYMREYSRKNKKAVNRRRRKHRRENKDEENKKLREYRAKGRGKLSDLYVREQLKKQGFTKVQDSVIELKRQLIKAKRLLKEAK